MAQQGQELLGLDSLEKDNQYIVGESFNRFTKGQRVTIRNIHEGRIFLLGDGHVTGHPINDVNLKLRLPSTV